ncbi:MAG: DNA-processing protein DprA [Clostridia bacterium]|nr:DNA-processing protein DprA [Clostridia bacterium]
MKYENADLTYLLISYLKITDVKRLTKLRQLHDEIGDFFNELPSLKAEYEREFGEEFTQKTFELIENKPFFEKELNRYYNEGIVLVDYDDSRYPERLKQIHNPPVLLYAKGDLSLLESENTIGVVGPRKITDYGINSTKIFVEAFVKADITVVSGIAIGTDGLAHRETLRLGGKTIAVLPCGQNLVYPSQNADLYRAIAEKGLRISEYPLDLGVAKYTFAGRNRIINGLSDALFVPEAAKGSGTAITMSHAVSEGNTIYAVPGSVFSKESELTNEYINSGKARMASDPDVVLKGYGLGLKKEIVELTDAEMQVVRILKGGETHFDDLAEKSGLSASELLVAISAMECQGVINSNGNYYILNKNKKYKGKTK